MSRSRALLISTAVSSLLAVSAAAALPAGAAIPLVKRLISTAAARQLGFPTVANAATSSTKTGTKLCGDGAEVVFQNKPTITGLVDEVFFCHSAKNAKQLLAEVKAKDPASPGVPIPKALGTTAFFSVQQPVFAFYWARGDYLGFVGFDTAATSNKSQQAAGKLNPLKSAEAATLIKAAVEQNTLLK
jgi:hypothetical protein